MPAWTKAWPTADPEMGLRREGLSKGLAHFGRSAGLQPSELEGQVLLCAPETCSNVGCIHAGAVSYHSSSGAGSSAGEGGSSHEMTPCALDMPLGRTCCTGSKSRALASAALQCASLGAASDRGGRSALATSTTSRSPDFIFAALCDSRDGEGPAALCRERLAANVLGARRVATKNNIGRNSNGSASRPSGASHAECGPRGADGGDTSALKALSEGLAQTQEDIRSHPSPTSTGVLALLIHAGGRALNIAWTGDCQAVLCRSGQPLVLTAANRRSTDAPQRARSLDSLDVSQHPNSVDSVEMPQRPLSVDSVDMPQRPLSVDSLAESSITSTPGLVLHESSEESTPSPSNPRPAGATAQPGASPRAPKALPSPAPAPGVPLAPAEFCSEPFHAEDEFLLLATRGLWSLVNPAEAVRLARAHFAADYEPPAVAEKLAALAAARGERASCCCGEVTVQVLRLFTRTVAEQGRPAPSLNRLRSMDGAWPSFLDIPTTPNFCRVVGGF
jgi:serine/threonine protein phosphatase PrpC